MGGRSSVTFSPDRWFFPERVLFPRVRLGAVALASDTQEALV